MYLENLCSIITFCTIKKNTYTNKITMNSNNNNNKNNNTNNNKIMFML